MRDEYATAAARGDVAGPVSQAIAIDFCQANDLILPGVHWWKRDNDGAARGDVTGPVSQARPTDLVLLQYCSGRRDQWAMRQDFQYLNIQRLVLHLLLLRHNHHYGL